MVGEVAGWGDLGLVGEEACCSPLGPAAGAGAADAMEPGAGFLGLCQPAWTGSTREASVGLTVFGLAAEGLVAVALAALVLVVVLGAADPVSMSILMARACLSCSSLEAI